MNMCGCAQTEDVPLDVLKSFFWNTQYRTMGVPLGFIRFEGELLDAQIGTLAHPGVGKLS